MAPYRLALAIVTGITALLPGLASAALFSEYANVPNVVPTVNKLGDPTGPGGNTGGDAVAVLDANGDGLLDFVLITGGSPYYTVVLNGRDSSGVTTFTPQPATYVGLVGDRRNNRPSGFGLHDFDDDGLLDLYLTTGGKGAPTLRDPRPPIDLRPANVTDAGLYRDAGYRTHLSQGDGTFAHVALNADGDGNTRSAVFADFDGDGHEDVFMSNAPYFGIWWVGSSAPNQLRPGLPDGTFGPNVLDAAVVNDPTASLWRDALGRANHDYKGVVTRDFDRDGKPDLILSAFSDIWDSVGTPPIDVQDPAGALVDVDGDLLPDGGYQGDWERGILVLRNVSTPGTIAFENVSATAIDNALGRTDQMHTYVTVPADIDGDGDLDLLCSGPRYFFAHNSFLYDTDRVRVYRNDSTPGAIVFTNVTATSGVDFMNDDSAVGAFVPDLYPAVIPGVMRGGGALVLTPLLSAAAALDVDNDGDVDWVAIDRQLFSRNPLTNEEFSHWVFLNDGAGGFTAVQPADHGMVHTARDLAYGDLNGDGRLDIVSVNGSGGGQSVDDNNWVWFNATANANHHVFVTVRLPGNRLGIGTKVTVYEPGTTSVVGFEEMRTDFAYRSKRPALLHFGLGALTSVDIRLEAPDGQTILHQGLGVDTTHGLGLTRDVLVAGRRLVVKNRLPDDEARNTVTVIAKGPSLATPRPGTGDDPRCGADPRGTVKARLAIESATAGSAHTTDLPCQNWVLIGSAKNPKGYRYKDRKLDDGTAKTVVWSGRRLEASLSGKGPTILGYDLRAGVAQTPIDVRFESGATRICLRCGAPAGRDGSNGKSFNAKAADCPAPAECAP